MQIRLSGKRPALLAGGLAVLLAVSAVFLAMNLRGNSGPDRNDALGPLDDLIIDRDIVYAPGERHGLDIYAPVSAKGEMRPVIVYLYGGAWVGGSKEQHAWVGAGLARQGYVAVVPDYRLYPPAHWPDFVRDGAAAVKWVKDNIADQGGDPAQIVVMGHSAGAFNALSLAVEPQWLAEVGMEPVADIKAVVGLSGVYNMLPLHGANENAIFGDSTGYREMIHNIEVRSPPTLFLVSSDDTAAGADDSVRMAARMNEMGGTAEVITYDGLGHDGTQAGAGGAFDAPDVPIQQDIARFLGEHGVQVPQASD